MPKVIIKQTNPVYKRSSELYRTGQTTSYATGDDGDLELGNGASFYTLSENNPFGNTSRFTLLNGTQITNATTYAGIGAVAVIDWSRVDYVNEKCLVYWSAQINGAANQTWANALTNGAADPTGGAFAIGWHLTNFHELIGVLDFGYPNNVLMPLFMQYTSTDEVWCSTTTANNTANAFNLINMVSLQATAKTNTYKGYQCRDFTFSELGI
jgi:hypothetical protein